MHEIVTLQFGQRANYLATHFWNIQESYFTYAPNTEPSIVDHDINFRPGLGTDGSDTYTPRTIIYDLKGGFGTLKQQNALYDDTSQRSNVPGIWGDNGLTTIKQQPIPPILYQQNLDAGLPTSQLHKSQIRYWSDFNRVFFHPRSIIQLNEYSLNSSIAPFENWAAGEELFRDVDREADLLDRDVRAFVEECDSIQGFQVFTGSDDAWGGWTSRYIDSLRDEYGKKCIWTYSIEDNRQTQREKLIAKNANVARTLGEVGKLASTYIPLCTQLSKLPSYLKYDPKSEWESTALMAAAVESATLATRLRTSTRDVKRHTMPQYEQFVNSDEGRNFWELGLNLDQTEETPIDSIRATVNSRQNRSELSEDQISPEEAVSMDVSFTPNPSHLLPLNNQRSQRTSSSDVHTFTQILTSRFPKRSSTAHKSTHLDQETLTRLRYAELPLVQSFAIPLPFPLLDAYPADLFSHSSHQSSPSPSPSQSSSPSTSILPKTASIPLQASLSTSSRSKRTLFDLRDLVTRQNRVIALDEREDLYNSLTELGEKYTFGWESDEDDMEEWGSGEE